MPASKGSRREFSNPGPQTALQPKGASRANTFYELLQWSGVRSVATRISVFDPWHRRFQAASPKVTGKSQKRLKLHKEARFHEVGVRSKFVRARYVLLTIRTAQDNSWNYPAFRVVLHPLQNVKSRRPRHFQIGKKNARERELHPVCILPFALQISQHVCPVGQNSDRICQPNIAESALQ
jgi:hypothetical protein